jgi:hypothetical protein
MLTNTREAVKTPSWVLLKIHSSVSLKPTAPNPPRLSQIETGIGQANTGVQSFATFPRNSMDYVLQRA